MQPGPRFRGGAKHGNEDVRAGDERSQRIRKRVAGNEVAIPGDANGFAEHGDDFGHHVALDRRIAHERAVAAGHGRTYKFTHTLLVCVYFSSASRPWSRPKPDSLKPPNGRAGS